MQRCDFIIIQILFSLSKKIWICKKIMLVNQKQLVQKFFLLFFIVLTLLFGF